MTADPLRAPVRLLLFAAGVLLLLLSAAAPAAATGPPQEGSGTGWLTAPPEILSQRQAGTNSVQERVLTMQVTGTLEGTFVQRVRGVVHDGQFVTFQGTATFTGTMPACWDGVRTLTLGIAGNGAAGALPVTDSTVRVIGQAGDDAPVRGVGTVHQDGFGLTYQLQYLC